MNTPGSMSNISLLSAFLVGVILFIAIGKNWLALESALVFLAGLIGIALAVLVFGVIRIFRDSRQKR